MSDFKWNEERQTFEITNVGIIEKAKTNLDKLDKSKVIIENDEDYKKVYDARTQVNNLVKDLATKRKQMEAIALSSFKPQCIEVEKYGATISDNMTKSLNAYKPKEKKATTYSITIKTQDLRVIKKFETMALKYGCQITTKEG